MNPLSKSRGRPSPTYRSLRCYALDPSLAHRFATVPISEVLLRIPWESLLPGPVGEYLEVVDIDPAGNCFYEPVDLEDTYVLAENGLAPAEDDPQFHQQMVYAVAQLTIHNFERALGRKALWSPGPPGPGKHPGDDSYYVQRLRVYPHALREANAYYSPAKKALLFGYFPATLANPGDHVPGGMVFTALSQDVIAHETAHALLDGQHRRLRRATNPDVLAFHEAFADVVALFQHFTFPEILRHQIASTRGDIDIQENLLGQLAVQFGHTIGIRGALRDAIGHVDPTAGRWVRHQPDPAEYDQAQNPHARGAILVAAIFEAFLSIYRSRTSDLLRLYTGGTGVLPPGAVHPDLVNRLAEEASDAADHVLRMCVRALDYCPPVDLTFDDYLRALITADVDLMPEDTRNYRVAFIEAFRRRGIFPREVRATSVAGLRWRTPEQEDSQPSPELVRLLHDITREARVRISGLRSRREIFDQERRTRILLHRTLMRHLLESGEVGRRDAHFLGLQPDTPVGVQSAHLATRLKPDGSPLMQIFVHLLQAVTVPSWLGEGEMYFEGGSTLIMDLTDDRITYCIRKPVADTTRQARERHYLAAAQAHAGLRATYFGESEPGDAREPFAILHRATG